MNLKYSTYCFLRWHKSLCGNIQSLGDHASRCLTSGISADANIKVVPQKKASKRSYAEVINVGEKSATINQRRVAGKLNTESWRGISFDVGNSGSCIPDTHAVSSTLPSRPAGKQKKSPGARSKRQKEAQETSPGSAEDSLVFDPKQIEDRNLSFNLSVISFLEMCLYGGWPNRALNTLYHYRDYAKTSELGIRLYIKVYNAPIKYFASMGNCEKCLDLIDMARLDGVSPNADSYVFVLESLARRSRSCDVSDLLQQCIQRMDDEKINMADAEHSSFRSRILARSLLQSVCPERDIPLLPPAEYTCPVLLHMNKDFEQPPLVESPLSGVEFNKPLGELTDIQLDRELARTVEIPSAYHSHRGEEQLSEDQNALEKVLLDRWRRDLRAAFFQMLRPIQQQFESKVSRQFSLYPFLSILPPERYVEVIVAEVRLHIRGFVNPNMGMQQLYRRIGTRVMDECSLELRKITGQLESFRSVHRQYTRWLAGEGRERQTFEWLPVRQKWMRLQVQQLQEQSNRLQSQQLPQIGMEQRGMEWSALTIYNIGSLLCRLIINHVRMKSSFTKMDKKTEQTLPCFYTAFVQDGVICKRVMRVHPKLLDVFNAPSRSTLLFSVRDLPMEAPPVPWSSIHSGGMFTTSEPLIRYRVLGDTVTQQNRILRAPPQQMYPIYDSINQLGCTPWIINKKILAVALEIFRSGGCAKLDLPSLPEPEDAASDKYKGYEGIREKAIRTQERHNQFSLWSTANYQLSIANFFSDRVFFMPLNIDFRGRVYPIASFVSHVSSDMPRSFLLFARGVPLGEGGLRWLKIHLMNLTGRCKKMTNDMRLEECDKAIDDIMESADNPIHGRGWWRTAEDPWQTLSACMELTSALRSPDPCQFVSHLPIHQDGSCNGLQHYAALGRDSIGAKSANLAPSDRPQDVYSDVADKVEQLRSEYAAKGCETARKLEGCLERRVIKQTVMTTVYGVTEYGAREQMLRQLKEFPHLSRSDVYECSIFLAQITFLALKSMFSSARSIQDWLVGCSRYVCMLRQCPVEWVTPLGLPVVQPYFSKYSQTVTLGSEGSALVPTDQHYTDNPPRLVKQRNAFPPNYIHSLDSAHMMLTALHCVGAGVTFASVHDCFWTHAARVPAMNRICRLQFVRLHEEPLLEQLREHILHCGDPLFQANIQPGVRNKLIQAVRAIPACSDFNLNSVIDSEYFFS